jgi:tRNA threonylcarbamoyladenosine biosynthesis protein TsaE
MINSLELVSHGADETHAIGFRLGLTAKAGDVILMTGELGTGKTTMAQGIAEGLGVVERPRSPTFVMATEYMGRLPLYHLDLYRVEQAAELSELGLEEYVSSQGVTVIEWADKAPEMFLSECLWISLNSTNEETRQIKLIANGSRHRTFIHYLQGSNPDPEGY